MVAVNIENRMCVNSLSSDIAEIVLRSAVNKYTFKLYDQK